jgi:hypothetical protein
MELREALTQIAEIRQQMARGQVFRGYRSATTAFSGFIALIAGAVQMTLLPDPAKYSPNDARAFVLLWVAAAVLNLLVAGLEMAIRTRRSNSQVQRQLTLLAVEQFTPSLVAGALLTWVFFDGLPADIWMLPGLWMILISLGMFASARLLPRAVFGIGAFYLLAGIFVLLATRDPHSPWRLSPWIMGGIFGIGQFAAAFILYWKLERSHV